MKRFFHVLPFAALLAIHACSNGDQPQSELKKAAAVSKQAVVTANRELSAEISGMVCQMGCGGAIRKELKATGAVAECSFDFQEDREWNTATITFDKDKISADKIVKIISTINEKQFTVGKTSTSEYKFTESEVAEASSGESSDEKSRLNMDESGFEMPNLLKLFSRLISGYH